MARSRNPDLLFPDLMVERADRVSALYCKGDMNSAELDRVTLFVTHRCNLFCDYCNGPHMDKSMPEDERRAMLNADLKLEQYIRLLDDWSAHDVKSVHFTGGEATLSKDLPEFIRLASEKSISTVLTTNGTASPDLYTQLIEKGLREVRVSVDSLIPEQFDALVKVKGTTAKVKDTISAITELRDAGKDVYLILNACVGSFNIDSIKNTLDSMIALSPDAIKFLVVAEEAEKVRSTASREFVDSLLDYVKSSGRDDELLETKIRNLFRKGSFGLKGRGAKNEMKRCFIPLTERTLDSRSIYPCSIYLRYKGEPIAGADLDFEGQQAAILDFVDAHDCRDDPICVDSCTNCCKTYNIEVNRRIAEEELTANARKQGPIRVGSISDLELRNFRWEHMFADHIPPKDLAPFVIIKPYGLSHEEDILDYLDEQGLVVTEQRAIDDWQALSQHLYLKGADDKTAKFKMARNKAFAKFEKGNRALYLCLEVGIPEKKLARIKSELRRWYPGEYRFMLYEGEEILLRSNCVHVPDYQDIKEEKSIVRMFTARKNSIIPS